MVFNLWQQFRDPCTHTAHNMCDLSPYLAEGTTNIIFTMYLAE